MKNFDTLPPEFKTDAVRAYYEMLDKRRVSLVVKRIFDVTVSLLAFIVLLPFYLIISILIKLDSPGKIFYCQTRVTTYGRVFKIYKFRSMNNACDEDGKLLHPSKRITPFGRVLRRTSLDELAGLFNIFNGTMSIIGPRPLMKDYLPLYSERHKYRHAVRPGLACWKVGGSDKLTSSTWTWNAQFESDIYYVEHVSFALDVWMVLKTVKIVFTKSEMRTNSDRIKFDGKNLLETRPRHEIIA